MLHELQHDFLTAIYDTANEEIAYQYIIEDEAHSASEQIAIYRGSIYGGLKNALAETYPVVKALVGDNFFEAMLGRYINAYPCQVQDLNKYGFELAAFIQNFKPAESIPYLTDVALLEWSMNFSSNAKVQASNLVDLAAVNEAAQSNIIFNLPVGSTLLQSDYAVDDIWGAHQQDFSEDLNIVKDNFYYLIYKSSSDVNVDRLSDAQFFLLSCINTGMLFSSVCEKTLNEYPEAQINDLFSDAIQHAWVQTFSFINKDMFDKHSAVVI